MAVTKGKKTEETEETEEETEEDPHAEAKGLLREVVDEALAEWTKKNKPAPRKTDPAGEGQPNIWESFFGKL